jgi:decaprenylphospho-beta-D-erythro-pentofuranosid-2-ulose 2-reductase
MKRRDASPRRPATLPRRVLLLGGTSEIGAAILCALEVRECQLVLAGRDIDALASAARRLRAAGCARVETIAVDARDPARHRAALEQAAQLLGGIELVVLAVGVLGERGAGLEDIDGAIEVLRVNALGASSLLLESARTLRAQEYGTIVVLSSVAAERARASNAVYCASKSGLDALAQGLADALAATAVRVLVVRPGFVTTRMTRGLSVPPLATNPQTVARVVVRALEGRAQTVWAPPRLHWVMLLVRLLPRTLFRRLRL